ncbi:hypothetical protein AB0K00_21675 [Dactylosporangium sp. NPDC049525]|uniref:hypothetical protein n=1 Tax=Dactylosporangium sp. NPDC049525 TaxID=3154730 RepID=UPI00343967F2
MAMGDLFRLALQRFGGKTAPAVASAIGAATSGSGLTAESAVRAWVQRKLRIGEYSPEELDDIAAEVMEAIAKQTEDRAQELERWLT